ncbi:SDR family NAD(P)-dependent oxidoreductase [Ensifer adhaerens]|uniref:SDR family NAD(P)-dependent oxidoreductase n=1 Tax=Ensifer TaxID=106591 RepID=UPI00177B9663|nr:SDR family NAD(P)-dependent oxidoreductase [Ensifer sp. ENS08]MBD9573505.1 SDR family NAD(P)-dependent oxidoreductase [Ensifer sp. ENS08]
MTIGRDLINNHALHETDRRKVAWVTGASSGIGKSLALRLALDGWTVAVSARNSVELDTLARSLENKIHSFPLDVTDREAAENTVRDIEMRLGPISLAVFGAGTYRRDSLSTFDAAAIGEMVGLNIMGTVNCLQAIMPAMTTRRSGRIAVMASVAGYTGLPGAAGYGATKAALINMCEALYPELERQGVQMTIINPGFVDTPLTRQNDFPMPFLISSESAAEYIMRGLERGKFEIAFPWRMKVVLKLLKALPPSLRFALTRRMLREEQT